MTRIASSQPFPVTGLKVTSQIDLDVRGEAYIDITFIVDLMDAGTSINYLLLGTNDALQWDIEAAVVGVVAGPIVSQTFVHAARHINLKYTYYRIIFETMGTFLAQFNVTATASVSNTP